VLAEVDQPERVQPHAPPPPATLTAASPGASGRLGGERVGAREVLEAERDERAAVEPGRELARLQLVAHHLGERRAPPRAAARRAAVGLGPPRLELEVEGAPAVLAQRLVVHVAHHVARHVLGHEAHDLVVDAAGHGLDRGAHRAVELPRVHAGGAQRGELHQLARAADRVEGVRAGDEVALDDPLARDARLRLVAQLHPRAEARVVDGARVVRVRLDLAVHVVVAEGDVVPLGARSASRGISTAARSAAGRLEPNTSATSPCSSSTFHRRAGSGESSGRSCPGTSGTASTDRSRSGKSRRAAAPSTTRTPHSVKRRRMHPVSAVFGASWLPATITTSARAATGAAA
jgi:hypothetical protein